ncbi:MAG TPA: nuclear transport factor 2 family protein [Thioalkalivibrio sp.]|nr:nuclear transport factor 2 family protein [Thioalkalivibrio sp.]
MNPGARSEYAPSQRLRRYAAFFEGLSPDALARLDEVLTEDAHFRDPFNDVHGLPAIRRIFEHMYQATEAPTFRVLGMSETGDVGHLHWEMRFSLRRGAAREWRIEGMSRVRFSDDGRVSEHVDFWDPVESLLARLPVVGALFRLPVRLLRTPQPRM